MIPYLFSGTLGNIIQFIVYLFIGANILLTNVNLVNGKFDYLLGYCIFNIILLSAGLISKFLGIIYIIIPLGLWVYTRRR